MEKDKKCNENDIYKVKSSIHNTTDKHRIRNVFLNKTKVIGTIILLVLPMILSIILYTYFINLILKAENLYSFIEESIDRNISIKDQIAYGANLTIPFDKSSQNLHINRNDKPVHSTLSNNNETDVKEEKIKLENDKDIEKPNQVINSMINNDKDQTHNQYEIQNEIEVEKVHTEKNVKETINIDNNSIKNDQLNSEYDQTNYKQLENEQNQVIPVDYEINIKDDVIMNTIEKKKSKPQEVKEVNKRYQGKKIYLTFDDGPSKHTKEILNILKHYNVKATFFVIGKTDKFSKKIYKRIVNEGHTLGMHSYSHQYNQIYRSLEDFELA